MYIKIFKSAIWVIYPTVFNEFIYYNQFVIKIKRHINIIKNKQFNFKK